MNPVPRAAHCHDVKVTFPPATRRTARQIRRWQQYLADERAEAAGYRKLGERRTGEEREILLALADAEKRHESHWLDLLGDDVGPPRRSSVRTRLLVSSPDTSAPCSCSP
jgi:vacuolar iron transporter family protein